MKTAGESSFAPALVAVCPLDGPDRRSVKIVQSPKHADAFFIFTLQSQFDLMIGSVSLLALSIAVTASLQWVVFFTFPLRVVSDESVIFSFLGVRTSFIARQTSSCA